MTMSPANRAKAQSRSSSSHIHMREKLNIFRISLEEFKLWRVFNLGLYRRIGHRPGSPEISQRLIPILDPCILVCSLPDVPVTLHQVSCSQACNTFSRARVKGAELIRVMNPARQIAQ